jgi:divalent metal cation (Fe/Co/Zn/Cd) transporter
LEFDRAAVAIGAGIFAGSIALLGFGIDSLIESLSGGILLWRLHATDTTEKRERLAIRLVGVSFFVLALYVAVEAGTSLLRREQPEKSVVGIILSILSLIVMPLLARAKRRVAAKIDSRALHADSRQTDICAYLSAILLGGLLLNAFFGWWWADPSRKIRGNIHNAATEPCATNLLVIGRRLPSLILVGNAFNLVSVLLAGLVLNAATCWWWIDSVGSLAIVPLLIREGWESVLEH